MAQHWHPGFYWLRDNATADRPESWFVGEWDGAHWYVWEDCLSDLEISETVIGPRIPPPCEVQHGH
jgi:hypothetical protein